MDGRHFSPDVICSFCKSNGEAFIFCLEVYNGDKVKYATEQLEKLFWIIDKTKKIEAKIGLIAIPRILCVCDNEKLKDGIIKRLKVSPVFWVEGIEELVFFGLDSILRNKFKEGWTDLEFNVHDINVNN